MNGTVRRFVQVMALAFLASLAIEARGARSEASCKAICESQRDECLSGAGNIWQCNCDFTAGYYDFTNDICDLDAFCWHPI
jgi:hypothetical protein